MSKECENLITLTRTPHDIHHMRTRTCTFQMHPLCSGLECVAFVGPFCMY